LASRKSGGTNRHAARSWFFLKASESDEQIEITYYPGSGPVQVQPDLTHLAFEVDNLEEFGKHLCQTPA